MLFRRASQKPNTIIHVSSHVDSLPEGAGVVASVGAGVGAGVGEGEIGPVGAGVLMAEGAGVAKAGVSTMTATKSPLSPSSIVAPHDTSVWPAKIAVPSDPNAMLSHQSSPKVPSCRVGSRMGRREHYRR